MTDKKIPIFEEMHKLLNYCPDTGEFVWKERPTESFANYVVAASFKKRFAGKKAGTLNILGYWVLTVNGKRYLAHRVAWLMHYGHWPKGQLDHINGAPKDNRIKNLRDTTPSENHRNMKLFSNSTSGVTGVNWMPRLNKWRATISLKGKQKHLGVFVEKEDAVAARLQANKRYGFHTNHGRNGSV
jgi:hypothetical protein